MMLLDCEVNEQEFITLTPASLLDERLLNLMLAELRLKEAPTYKEAVA